jgi:hypothetical protein
MKKYLTVFAALVFFLCASSAFAQMSKSLTLGGGMSFLQSPDIYKDYWKRGIVGSAGLGLGLIPGLSIHGVIEYNKFPLDEDKIRDLFRLFDIDYDIEGKDISVISFFAMGKLSLLLSMPGSSPYVIGGVGYVHASLGDVTITGTSEGDKKEDFANESATAVTFGGGFDFKFAPRIGVFLEGRYVKAFTDGDDFAYFPLKIGLNISL